jgi:outer membrane protein OmpA-like peptidoglycan-associated protein
MYRFRVLLGAALCAAMLPAWAASPSDMPGAQDHPLLSRYAGSVLQASASLGFESLPVARGAPLRAVDGGLNAAKAPREEGQIRAYFYIAPQGRTALEVFRNYEQALGAAGFKLLYRCEMRTCDSDGLTQVLAHEQLDRLPFPRDRLASPRSPFERDLRFLSAEFEKGGRRAMVQLYVAEPDSIWQTPKVMQIVIEPKALVGGQVLVSAQALQGSLASEGRVALYGVYFDAGKAQLKPESWPQLQEMAKLLAAQPALKVAIVGHTDSQGAAEANLQLSQQRAEAVREVLQREHGVTAARLQVRGLGPFSPVATNRDEAGRSRNRRVELVELP